MRRSKPSPKPYWEMNAKELAAATAEFDKEFAADRFGPPPPRARARWTRARRKRGRPRVGKGVAVISLSIEKTLLQRADALARRQGVSRAQLVARGLESVLKAAS